MKKKSLITMSAALSLVAVVGIGATLAYLSDTTEVVTNTFTVGNVAITLDETDIDGNVGDRTDEGNDYTNIQPGDVLTKDPVVHLTEGSEEAYVFIKVEGLDDLLGVKGKNAAGEDVNAFALDDDAFDGWIKVSDDEDDEDDYDGVYRYEKTLGGDDVNAVKDTDPLFNSITCNTELVEYEDGEVPNISDIELTGYAIQKKNLAAEDAYEQLFGEE